VGEILDEPMADASIVPTFLLSRVARKHVTVALGGDGGDELFAGYPTYAAHKMARFARPVLRGRLLAVAERAAAALPVSHRNLSFDFKVKKTLSGLSAADAIRNYVWLGAFHPGELAEVLGRGVDEEELFAPVAATYREAPGASHLERVLYQDVRLYLCHEILVKVDRASMANSLEVRAPLLDTAFAEYVAALPTDAKLHGLQGKAIFKRALAPWLPDRVIHRSKKGFGMPIGRWLRGPLAELSRDLLLGAGGLASAGLVERAPVERLLDEHARSRADHRKRLWTLMVLELWRRANLVKRASA
jgi:asparagine synthase (glutamine-hydrolysing)